MLGYAGPMTITLCIDTSTSHCSVALAVGDDVFADTQLLERRHNQEALPMLDALYQRSGQTVANTQLVSFAAGPGGFTGVRIAASIAQGIAMACGCKVVPQRGSTVIVNSWAPQQLSVERLICFVASRGQAFYVSEYRTAQRHWVMQRPDELVDAAPPWLEDLATRAVPVTYSDLAIIGPRPNWLPEVLSDCCVGEVVPDATTMIGPARNIHALGSSVDAERALPIYVQGDSPWRKRR